MPSSKISDYEVLYTIGSGSYGKCLKVRRRSDNKVLVWKDMDYGSMTENEKQQLVSEVNLLRELKHPHIVRYHDRIIDRSRSRLYLVMEYCAGGDLASIISKHRRERKLVDEEFVTKILLQLVLALQACHNQRNRSGNSGRILHRDLKPANVFLDESKNVKLGDFGLARVLHHDTSFAKTFVGTPYYMSPEQMKKDHYNEKSDLWSLGCLIYELCSLVPPFTAPNQRLLAVKIKEGSFRPIPSKYSVNLQSCVSSMLRQTPNARPSLDELLELPFLRKALELHGGVFAKKDEKSKVIAQPKAITDTTEAKRDLLSSSDTSVKSEKRSAELEKIENERTTLEEKMRELRIKERELQRREYLVEEREKAAEEKMKTAESLIKQYRQMRSDLAADGIKETNDYVKNKHVKFTSNDIGNGKENIGIAGPSYERGHNLKKINYGLGYDRKKIDELDDYRRKLNQMHANHKVSDQYKGRYRLRNDNKPRQVLGMR